MSSTHRTIDVTVPSTKLNVINVLSAMQSETISYTVDSHYLNFAYLEYPLISK